MLATVVLVITALAATPAIAQPQGTEVMAGHKQQLQTNTHALGFTGGWAGATGFCYRHYLQNTFLQLNALPVMANRGDFLMLMGGLTVGHYLIVWNSPSMGTIIPSTTALRAVATLTASLSRDTTTDAKGVATTTSDAKRSLGGGVGFEFGALMRNGFSISFDLMFTALWDDKGFDSLLPLPYGAIVYNW